MTSHIPRTFPRFRRALTIMTALAVGFGVLLTNMYAPKKAATTEMSARGLHSQTAKTRLRIGDVTALAKAPFAHWAKVDASGASRASTDTQDITRKRKNVEVEKMEAKEPLVGGSLWRALEAELRGRPDFEALTSTKSVRPFRRQEEMAQTQACFRARKGSAFLLHMRKAGGTTLRNYLSALVENDREQLVYVAEGRTFNVSCFHDQGEMMILTSLRQPLARILSSYWYEGRYDYKPAPLVPGTDPALAAAIYDETKAKAAVPLSFQDWVRYVRQMDYIRWTRASARGVWYSVDNYYVQTLTNRYRHNTYAEVGKHDYELARRVLASFDVVMITEWMGWANQTAYVQESLGEKGKDPSRGMNQRNKLIRVRDDTEIDREMFASVWRANTWDLLLYEFAKNLVTDRLAAFEKEKLQVGAQERSKEALSAANRSSQEGERKELICQASRNDPRWRRDGRQDYYKPNPDSYLYVMPQCMDPQMHVETLKTDLR